MKLKLPQQIEAKRIVLKKHTLDKEHIRLLVDCINESREWLRTFLPHFDKPATVESEEAFIKEILTEEKEINYGIWKRETEELIGTIGVFNPDNPNNPKSAEISIMLFEKYAGNHYGPEATQALEGALFQNGLESVILKIQKENMRSQKAAESNGHVLEGKETVLKKGNPDLQMLVYKKFANLERK